MSLYEAVAERAGRPPEGMTTEWWHDVVAEAAVAIANAQAEENDGTPETYAVAALRAALPMIRANLRRRERAVLDRVDDVVRTVGTLNPQNPADVAAVARNFRIATSASRMASEAARCARRGMFEEAEAFVAEAEQLVSA